MHWTTEQVALVLGLAGRIVLCSWLRNVALVVPLSTQVYEGKPVNLFTQQRSTCTVALHPVGTEVAKLNVTKPCSASAVVIL